MTRGATDAERRRLGQLVARIAADQQVTPELLASGERSEALVRVRFALVWLAREAIGISYTEIATRLGGRNRATLIHAFQRAQALRDTDPAFRALTDRLRAAMTEAGHG